METRPSCSQARQSKLRRAAAGAAVALFAAGEGLLLASGPRAALAGAVLVAAIVAYDAWHKDNPISPLLMGLCRALVYVVAALAVAGTAAGAVLPAAAVLGLYVAGLTQVSKAGPAFLARRLGALIAAIALYDALVTALGGGGAAAVAACVAAFVLCLTLQTRIAGT